MYQMATPCSSASARTAPQSEGSTSSTVSEDIENLEEILRRDVAPIAAALAEFQGAVRAALLEGVYEEGASTAAIFDKLKHIANTARVVYRNRGCVPAETKDMLASADTMARMLREAGSEQARTWLVEYKDILPAMLPPSPEWDKFISRSVHPGAPYWVHRRSGKTTWTEPSTPAPRDERAPPTPRAQQVQATPLIGDSATVAPVLLLHGTSATCVHAATSIGGALVHASAPSTPHAVPIKLEPSMNATVALQAQVDALSARCDVDAAAARETRAAIERVEQKLDSLLSLLAAADARSRDAETAAAAAEARSARLELEVRALQEFFSPPQAPADSGVLPVAVTASPSTGSEPSPSPGSAEHWLTQAYLSPAPSPTPPAPVNDGPSALTLRSEAVAPPAVDAVRAHFPARCETMQESGALDTAPVEEERSAATTSDGAQVAAAESNLAPTTLAELGSEAGADAAGAQEPPISADSQGSRQLWDPGGDNWASNVCTLF